MAILHTTADQFNKVWQPFNLVPEFSFHYSWVPLNLNPDKKEAPKRELCAVCCFVFLRSKDTAAAHSHAPGERVSLRTASVVMRCSDMSRR